MQSCARLGKIIEEAIKRCHQIQFFLWSSIGFFWMFMIFESEKCVKSTPLGMYFCISLLVFSMHLFCPLVCVALAAYC